MGHTDRYIMPAVYVYVVVRRYACLINKSFLDNNSQCIKQSHIHAIASNSLGRKQGITTARVPWQHGGDGGRFEVGSNLFGGGGLCKG